MSHYRSSEVTGFVECIRNGDLEGVQNFLRLRTGNLDKSNPRLKWWLKEELNDHKETPLHIAVKHQQESIVKWLLECGADICATDLYLRTVLHTACNENDGTRIIALILECKGVNVNARDENGITPVWLAVEKENSNAVKLLMDKGADITIANKADNTSLHVAAKTGHSDVLKLLLEKLANTRIIGKQNKDRETPLHLAVTNGNPQVVAMLLNAGAFTTMDVKNEQGQNATDLAKQRGNKRIISLLENPQKAKELFQAKPKPELGRFASVKSDSSANHTSNPVSPTSELPPVPQNTGPVQFITKHFVVHQQFNTTISGGVAAVGTGAQVVNTQDPTAVRPPRSGVSSGDRQYNLEMTGGNAAVGDNPVINLVPGTPGSTPSTAGSRDAPFFPEPRENSSTSSGFPTENPSSLRATESATHPTEEHSPGDKLDESARRPVQEAEDSPGYKVDGSSRHPVQEEHPRDPSDVSTLSRPVQEECPTDESHVSSTSPVQEECPKDGLKESLRHPVQEDHPTDSSDVSSLSRPVQEECPTDKSHVSSTSPVQEESPIVRIGPAKHADAVRNSSSEEAIAPSDAVEPGEHSRTAMDPVSCDKAGFLKASKQNWQEDIRQRAPRRDSPMTRGVSKVAQDRILKEASKSPANETLSWDQLRAPLELHNGPVAGARCGSSSSLMCAPSPSGSKESSHRKAQHSGEPGILHGTSSAGAGTNVNESVTTARNGQASFPGNHYGNSPVGTSRDNLSSGTQSSADGPSTAVEIKNDNPDDDRKGHESCNDNCRLM